MIIRDKTAEEIVALKKKLVELAAQGLFMKEILSKAGIDRSNLKTLSYDQMFYHHFLKARG